MANTKVADKEFTYKDMKQAFEAGARLAPATSWTWQRWIRSRYPERYVRAASKPKAAAAKAGK